MQPPRIHQNLPLALRIALPVANSVAKVQLALGRKRFEFSEQALLEAAQRSTGFSDFGDDSFREPFRQMLSGVANDDSLPPLGRRVLHRIMVTSLELRLKLANELKNLSSDERLERPLIVVSLPRTGTTLLHKLLARDPAARPLLGWEAVMPFRRVKDMRRGIDRRPVLAKRLNKMVRLAQTVAPGLKSTHYVNLEGPEECGSLMRCSFVVATNSNPAYRDWLLAQPQQVFDNAYRDYCNQLRVLQSGSSMAGRHWVLKAPIHMYGVASLLHLIPDASIVRIHRDPRKVIPSLCSLLASRPVAAMSFSKQRAALLPAYVLDWCKRAIERADAAAGAAEHGRILDINYKQLLVDPIDAVQRIYQHFNYEFTEAAEQAMRGWMADNPRDKHGRHRYSLDQFGLSPDAIDSQFEAYLEKYAIERETD